MTFSKVDYFQNVLSNIKHIASANLKKLRDPVDRTKSVQAILPPFPLSQCVSQYARLYLRLSPSLPPSLVSFCLSLPLLSFVIISVVRTSDFEAG